jgi:phosphoglycerol transferase MdoB-like AlkP superfamily enzyme
MDEPGQEQRLNREHWGWRKVLPPVGTLVAGMLGLAARWGFAGSTSLDAYGRIAQIALLILGFGIVFLAVGAPWRPHVLPRYLLLPALLLAGVGVFLLVAPSATLVQSYVRIPFGLFAVLGGLVAAATWAISWRVRQRGG